MFTRRPEEAEPRVVTEPEKPAPHTPKPMRDAECLKPSTFGSRSAASGKPAGPELVYMGTEERTVTNYRRGGPDEMELVDVALYFERRHPARRWYRFLPHGVLEPMFDDTKRDPEPTRLPAMNRKLRMPGSFDPVPADYSDPPPRPV